MVSSLRWAYYVILQTGLAAIAPHIGIFFIQTHLHNILHTHLWMVVNAVGSVATLSGWHISIVFLVRYTIIGF